MREIPSHHAEFASLVGCECYALVETIYYHIQNV